MSERLLSSVNSDYNNDLHNWAEIERQVTNIAWAGFTHTQWIHDWEGEYLYSASEMFQVRDLLRSVGVKAHSIHASEGGRRTIRVNGRPVFRNRTRLADIRKDYTSVNEYTRLAGVDLLKNRVDLCSHIGASVMVLHMQLPYEMFEKNPADKEEYYRQVCKSFDELRDYAKAAGVRVALENLICTPPCHQEEEFERMFDRYDEEFLGFCFDSGHGSLMCRDNYYYFLEKYYKRMYATHLQDNDSISEELAGDDSEVLLHDKHRPPFTGVLDWEKIADYAAKAPLQLPADFEVGIYGSTPEEEMEGLRDCREKAERFYRMVQQRREA
ncbi:sugar phosphate isomerase/epimerase [Anaerofilum sp. BX8]|uniref:Sugar phosphate isomerase/epimerase n=1 Tax=Anaerofilum hominis TaxID=2763016 RepID=A0A923I7P9_9FIRM|nr:sugar phosphate isomerase/epimerase family protein [Anaerofilum hominis]MBC5580664.1 sugar phosphate isomerase/epimerase [Anaerofilum hominis]